jgi:hypothetical protein
MASNLIDRVFDLADKTFEAAEKLFDRSESESSTEQIISIPLTLEDLGLLGAGKTLPVRVDGKLVARIKLVR